MNVAIAIKYLKVMKKLLNRYWSLYIFKTNYVDSNVLKDYENDIKSMCFCSKRCELEHMLTITSMLEEETLTRHNGDKDIPPDTFITKHTFMNNDKGDGYIYKISKKHNISLGKASFIPIIY